MDRSLPSSRSREPKICPQLARPRLGQRVLLRHGWRRQFLLDPRQRHPPPRRACLLRPHRSCSQRASRCDPRRIPLLAPHHPRPRASAGGNARMRAILFGATGMVGQGLLRECLLDPSVEHVLSIVRNPRGQQSAKLSELVHKDFFDFSPVESQLAGYDSCFYCAGFSSAGMTEESYSHATYDMTLAAAQTLARLNSPMTFLYVSGAGTDSTGKGRTMWARVKGKTENALLRLPFKAAYMFRPGVIQPLHGIQSKTASYRILYILM